MKVNKKNLIKKIKIYNNKIKKYKKILSKNVKEKEKN